MSLASVLFQFVKSLLDAVVTRDLFFFVFQIRLLCFCFMFYAVPLSLSVLYVFAFCFIVVVLYLCSCCCWLLTRHLIKINVLHKVDRRPISSSHIVEFPDENLMNIASVRNFTE